MKNVKDLMVDSAHDMSVENVTGINNWIFYINDYQQADLLVRIE